MEQKEIQKIQKMVETLFPDTSKTTIPEIIKTIIRCEHLGLNTTLRVAHFLAQVREELGSNFEPKNENLNYSADVLPRIFRKFTQTLANKYGRTSSHPANQEMIANIAYSDRLGNSDVNSGDGWRFRGRFALQITGKSNYQEVQKRIDRYLPNSINILEDSEDRVNSLEACIIAGAAFWIWQDLYREADTGTHPKCVDYVTEKINKYTESYDKRRAHFEKIKDLI